LTVNRVENGYRVVTTPMPCVFKTKSPINIESPYLVEEQSGTLEWAGTLEQAGTLKHARNAGLLLQVQGNLLSDKETQIL
jgi:hypothetical protein